MEPCITIVGIELIEFEPIGKQAYVLNGAKLFVSIVPIQWVASKA